jgi:hypothetical protein
MKNLMLTLCVLGASIGSAYAHQAKHHLSHEVRQSASMASQKKPRSSVGGRQAHVNAGGESNSGSSASGPASNY